LLLTLAVQARFFELPTLEQIRAQVSRISKTEVDTDDIAEAIEQLTRPTRRPAERIAFGVALLGVLVAAEFAALHPLATGEPKDGNPDVVYIALASGFLLIGGLALMGQIVAVEPAPKSKTAGEQGADDHRRAAGGGEGLCAVPGDECGPRHDDRYPDGRERPARRSRPVTTPSFGTGQIDKVASGCE
jgi:hypothetical protein